MKRDNYTVPLSEFYLTLIFLYVVLFVFIAGCTVKISEHVKSERMYESQINLYLNGPDKSLQDITFDLSSINIIADDGSSKTVMNTPLTINSMTVKGRQILLGERRISDGKYEKLQLVIKQASIKKKGKDASLTLPSDVIEIDINVMLRKNRNVSLFLNWNSDASFVDGYMFDPVFIVKGEGPELSDFLIYVTNEGSDNVSVINRDSGEVVSTIMVGKRPKGIAVSSLERQSKIYVANSESNTVSVIDVTTNKTEDEINVRLGWGPEDLAVSKVSSEKEFIFVTNYKSNSVSVFDSSTLQEIENINVGYAPSAITVDPPLDRLFGSNFLNQSEIDLLSSYREKFFNVYVVNEESNNVSVLRVNVFNDTIEFLANLDVEWNPVAVSVDYPRGKVYVANYDSDKLSVIDILKIIKGDYANAVSNINNIGKSIVGVISDPEFDRIYLLKERAGEIMIIRPLTENANSLNTTVVPVMGVIETGDLPGSFVLDSEARKLYVANRGSNSIWVIDKTTKIREQTIPVGLNPYGITVYQRN